MGIIKINNKIYGGSSVTASNILYNGVTSGLEASTVQAAIDKVSEKIEDTKSEVEELIYSNLINFIYPIGSIYMSVNNVSPSSFLGGTWEQIKDRFLLSAGSSYSAGSTGGTATHTHNYGLQYGGYYRSTSLESNTNAGILTYDTNNNISLVSGGVSQGTLEGPINKNATNGTTTVSMTHYRQTANTSYTNNMPPYLTVYMWKRIG